YPSFHPYFSHTNSATQTHNKSRAKILERHNEARNRINQCTGNIHLYFRIKIQQHNAQTYNASKAETLKRHHATNETRYRINAQVMLRQCQSPYVLLHSMQVCPKDLQNIVVLV